METLESRRKIQTQQIFYKKINSIVPNILNYATKSNRTTRSNQTNDYIPVSTKTSIYCVVVCWIRCGLEHILMQHYTQQSSECRIGQKRHGGAKHFKFRAGRNAISFTYTETSTDNKALLMCLTKHAQIL